MDDLISIIIPTYNRANTLSEAIQSVVEQSAGNWELIIIDDGSTDDSQEIIKAFLKDERIKYYYQSNAGVSAARNKGVELSRGHFIIFLDSDDKFLHGLFARLTEVRFSHNDLTCWQVLRMVDGKSSIWKPERLEKVYNNITALFLAGSVCYKKEVFLKAGGFDPDMSFGENYELGIRLGKIPALRIEIIDEPFLIYRIKSNNRPSSTFSKKISSHEKLLFKHRELYINDALSHSRLHYQLGFLKEKIGEERKALDHYKKAFKIRPVYLKAFLKTFFLKSKFFLFKREI